MDIDSKYSLYGNKLINWCRYDEKRVAQAREKAGEYARKLWARHIGGSDRHWAYSEMVAMTDNIMADFRAKYAAGRPAAVRSVKYECLAKCKCRTWTLSKI